MKFKSTLAALALASGLVQGASAATYNLAGSGGDLGVSEVFTVVGGPAANVTAGSAGILNGGLASLTQTGAGLGVNGRPDLNPNQIDGSPLFSSEYITISFAWAVRLVGFTLGGVDGNDNYDIRINGGSFTNGLVALVNNTVGVNNVTSFRVRASGTPFQDGVFGNDEFTIASVTVAPVPVPAAGVMLLAGLGGLAALRRRKVLV
jgi:hypothetical protein